MPPIIWWIRRDLVVVDNQALQFAFKKIREKITSADRANLTY
ncbi:MAG TPA: hypothetical protein VF313_11205 [Anaerolineaceae bacterium]